MGKFATFTEWKQKRDRWRDGELDRSEEEQGRLDRKAYEGGRRYKSSDESLPGESDEEFSKRLRYIDNMAKGRRKKKANTPGTP